MYRIEIRNAQDEVLARSTGEADARLIYREEYQPGDAIIFSSAQEHATVIADQAVAPAHVFLPEKTFAYSVPFEDAKNGYPPQAFSGTPHALWIGPVDPSFLSSHRNIAHNPIDQRGDGIPCYPHATANVETRGEAQFWARNAIDGTRFNDRHGPWPYHSWGIGERRDAWLRIDFGRPVAISGVGVTLRADFPHDAWWKLGTIECSDGGIFELPLTKTEQTQVFPIGLRTITWIMLRDLVKADDPSPFPALTQLEVYGHDAG